MDDGLGCSAAMTYDRFSSLRTGAADPRQTSSCRASLPRSSRLQAVYGTDDARYRSSGGAALGDHDRSSHRGDQEFDRRKSLKGRFPATSLGVSAARFGKERPLATDFKLEDAPSWGEI